LEKTKKNITVQKVLVTGAAGFIGMHTSQVLLARGDQVVGIDNLNDYYDVQLKLDRLARLTPHEAGLPSTEIALATKALPSVLATG
jgi:nucleoside-diphosphate-sugar epimerase